MKSEGSNVPQNKEELRQARLKAMGGIAVQNSNDNSKNSSNPILAADVKSEQKNDAGHDNEALDHHSFPPVKSDQAKYAETKSSNVRHADSPTLADRSEQPAEKKQAIHDPQFHPPQSTPRVLDGHEWNELLRVLYKGGLASEEDMQRWASEGFQFCVNPPFGLKQSLGGPCGVLAAVQAEIIRSMMFTESSGGDAVFPKYRNLPQDCSEEMRETALIDAFSTVLFRITKNAGPVVIASLRNKSHGQTEDFRCWTEKDLLKCYYSDKREFQAGMTACLGQYKDKAGCLLLLISAALTRGINNIKEDMDDSTSTCK